MSILRLQHTRSDGEVDTYHLKSIRRYHIGRGSNCEVRILDLKMSRQHCAIERQGSEWLVHDLGSTNGIKLDGSRIQGSAILGTGAVIKAGNTQLEVSDIDGDDDGAATELTPVRQEALPEEESDDERGVPERSSEGDDESLEPQSTDAEVPTSGALQAYDGKRTPSDEFELSDAYQTLEPAAAADPEPEPVVADEPPRPSAVKPLTIKPAVESEPQSDVAPATTEAGDELDGLELESDVGPAPQAARAAPADDGKAVKPVTIRVGTGKHPAMKDSSSSLYINVMGRRIGPLSRAEAREIKARELKGTLTEEDLDKYPGA